MGYVDNKRIAKNTLLLYARMLIMLCVSLYTSRVVLKVLGVEDFGIYNVVGGIVSILTFLNASMAGATQRFLNVELGRNNTDGLIKVFRTAQVIHVGVAIIVLILAETIGIWFLNTYMQIPQGRMYAANFVFQFSVITFMVTILSVPYNAAIIAHERMSAFAYISIIEVFLKLLIVYLLLIIPFDKLIVYSCLMALISIIIRIIYSIYCGRHFVECKRNKFECDKCILKKMLNFSGWTIFGALGSISHTQGVGLVLNYFFGVAINAAQGIANQVNSVISNFVANFMTALNPQIVKSYTSGDLNSMHKLLMRGCKMGFFLVAFFAIPLIFEAPWILSLWLHEVPEYTVIFIRIFLFSTICASFASPLAVAKGATGEIRNYQIILTTIGWMHIPMSIVFFVLGYPPQYAMYVYLFLMVVMQVCRIQMVCHSIRLRIVEFYKNVILRCILVLFASSIIPLLICLFSEHNMWVSLINILIAFVMVLLNSYVWGLEVDERHKIYSLVKNKLLR